jgi:hypothetical protein
VINQEEGYGRVLWIIWGKREVYAEFWCGDLMEKDHLKDLDVDGRILK